MDEIVPNLWIGDLPSALNTEYLREKNIHSIVTATIGKYSIHETFVRHQIDIVDNVDEDILSHLVSAITFIQKELDKGRGVLVHCVAGISRSATIVAAYLMYSRGLDPTEALKLMRQHRPQVDPNDGFLRQLDIFHKNGYQVSASDKDTRAFFLQRTKNQVISNEGVLSTDHFADGTSNTLKGSPRRRTLRCKMCRHHLATREHMVGHGLIDEEEETKQAVKVDLNTAEKLGEQISESISTAEANVSQNSHPVPPVVHPSPPSSSSPLVHPSAISAQLYANPQLAALRSPIALPASFRNATLSPPPSPSRTILANPKCSGYFVEPLKWMGPLLESGQMEGKIVCPNMRCKAKLGSFDWTGVCCGCKEWVVPGFCIHRSKVDEIE